MDPPPATAVQYGDAGNGSLIDAEAQQQQQQLQSHQQLQQQQQPKTKLSDLPHSAAWVGVGAVVLSAVYVGTIVWALLTSSITVFIAAEEALCIVYILASKLSSGRAVRPVVTTTVSAVDYAIFDARTIITDTTSRITGSAQWSWAFVLALLGRFLLRLAVFSSGALLATETIFEIALITLVVFYLVMAYGIRYARTAHPEWFGEGAVDPS
jgi:hypothetical protein